MMSCKPSSVMVACNHSRKQALWPSAKAVSSSQVKRMLYARWTLQKGGFSPPSSPTRSAFGSSSQSSSGILDLATGSKLKVIGLSIRNCSRLTIS